MFSLTSSVCALHDFLSICVMKLTPHDKSFKMGCMMNHSNHGEELARLIAEEIRVEMARQKRSRRELASVIGVTEHTAGNRLNGSPNFNTQELAAVASWLGITVSTLISRAEAHREAARALAAEGVGA